jgi:hypothetical protein
MSAHACPDCGGAIFFGAKRCSYCLPAKRLDRMEIAVTTVLLLAILLGGAYAGYLLARDPNRPSLQAIINTLSRVGQTDPKAETKDDYNWIAEGMQNCRQEAGKRPDSLHFMVVPLTAVNKEDVRWATRSTASAANAELLGLNDTLDGLRKGDLNLYSGEYAFTITSIPGDVTYKWASANGPSRFSTDEAEQIPAFRIAFSLGGSEPDSTSATQFKPTKGSCLWVGALITG